MNRFRHGQEKQRPGASQEFVETCILFMLKKGDGHGYEIARSLEKYGIQNKVAGPIYSTLNRMEGRGLINSRWDTNTKYGPARRVYSITEEGRLCMEQLVNSLKGTVQAVTSLLSEINDHSGKGPSPTDRSD